MTLSSIVCICNIHILYSHNVGRDYSSIRSALYNGVVLIKSELLLLLIHLGGGGLEQER